MIARFIWSLHSLSWSLNRALEVAGVFVYGRHPVAIRTYENYGRPVAIRTNELELLYMVQILNSFILKNKIAKTNAAKPYRTILTACEEAMSLLFFFFFILKWLICISHVLIYDMYKRQSNNNYENSLPNRYLHCCKMKPFFYWQGSQTLRCFWKPYTSYTYMQTLNLKQFS